MNDLAEWPIVPARENGLVNEPDKVLIYDDLAKDIILDLTWSETPNVVAFEEAFEQVGVFLASEDRYQGLDLIRVIKRKTDGRLFGFTYWEDISKHGEAHVEQNADAIGIEWEIPDDYDWNNDYYPSLFVFTPVEPFTIQAYRNIKIEIEGDK